MPVKKIFSFWKLNMSPILIHGNRQRTVAEVFDIELISLILPDLNNGDF